MINKIQISVNKEIVFFKSGGRVSVYGYTTKRHNTLKKINGYYSSANLLGNTSYVLPKTGA